MNDNVFEAMRTRLDGGKRWHKGSLHDASGNACLMGALNDVTGYSGTCDASLRAQHYTVLKEVVAEQYPERSTGYGGCVEPAYFNDHDDTTWADVDLVLDKAGRIHDERAS